MNLPKNLKYSEHVWVKAEDGKATLGVTDYALKAVKEIVFIDLPEEGQKLKKGEDFVSLESVKWSGHIESPVSGKVIEVNEALFDEPSKLNEDAYSSWICKVELDDESELDGLMSAEEASEWAQENA